MKKRPVSVNFLFLAALLLCALISQSCMNTMQTGRTPQSLSSAAPGSSSPSFPDASESSGVSSESSCPTTDADPTTGSSADESSLSDLSGQPTSETSSPDVPDGTIDALYLGVFNYGAENVDKDHIRDLAYRFFAEGREWVLSIDCDETLSLQNKLIEGELFRVNVDAEKVTTVTRLEGGALLSGVVKKNADGSFSLSGKALPADSGVYLATIAPGGVLLHASALSDGDHVVASASRPHDLFVVSGEAAPAPALTAVPGQKTLAGFLKTALSAAGRTLYIYGGGWNFQDDGAAPEAVSIGVSPSWTRFFAEQDGSYDYKAKDPKKSFYPFGAYNEYHAMGLDCSGFVGWALYNAVHKTSGEEGLVSPSTGFAAGLAKRGWGKLQNKTSALGPGDIVSIKGHVYIVLGVCGDGSVVILHSTPSDSYKGRAGGGVQISAIGESKDCEAYRLADEYMRRLCEEWAARYPVKLCAPSLYLDLPSSGGVFTFDLTGGKLLSDPDGARAMAPAELLSFLFS